MLPWTCHLSRIWKALLHSQTLHRCKVIGTLKLVLASVWGGSHFSDLFMYSFIHSLIHSHSQAFTHPFNTHWLCAQNAQTLFLEAKPKNRKMTKSLTSGNSQLNEGARRINTCSPVWWVWRWSHTENSLGSTEGRSVSVWENEEGPLDLSTPGRSGCGCFRLRAQHSKGTDRQIRTQCVWGTGTDGTCMTGSSLLFYGWFDFIIQALDVTINNSVKGNAGPCVICPPSWK